MDKEKIYRKLLLRLDSEIVKDNRDHRRLMEMAKAYGLPKNVLVSKKFLSICQEMERKGKLSSEKLDFLIEVFPETENNQAFKDICHARNILAGDLAVEVNIASETPPCHNKDPLYEKLLEVLEAALDEIQAKPLKKRLTLVGKWLSLFDRVKGMKKCLMIYIRCSTTESLENLWQMYRSGEVLEILQNGLVTKDLLEICQMESMQLEVFIAEADYQRCLSNIGRQDSVEKNETESTSEPAHNFNIKEEAEKKTGRQDRVEQDGTESNSEPAHNFDIKEEAEEKTAGLKSRPPTKMTSLDMIKSIKAKGRPGSTEVIVPVGRGQVWMTATRDKKLTLIDNTGNIIRYSDQICSDNSYIMSAVKYGDDILVIGYDEHKILRLRSDGSNLSVFYDAGTHITMDMCVSPESHVVLSLKSKIDAVDHDTKVLIIASSGKVIKTIHKDTNGKPVFDRPAYLVTTQKGKIIVVDNVTTPNKLICVNKNGSIEYKRNIKLDSQAVTFSGITYKDKKLYATDKQSGKAFVMNEDGTGAKCLLDNKTLTLPCGINFDDDGHLMVGCWERTIHTFKFQQSDTKADQKEKDLPRSQIEEYLKAISGCKDRKTRNIRIMLVGNKGTGKTSLCKNLQKENISSDLPSTNGIAIYIQRFVVNLKTKEFSKQPERSEHDTTLNKIRETLYRMKLREDNQDTSNTCRKSNTSEHSTLHSPDTGKNGEEKESNQTTYMENDPSQEKIPNDNTGPDNIESSGTTEIKNNDPPPPKDNENSESLKFGSQLSDECLKERYSDLHRAYTTEEEGEELGDNKSYASFWDFGGETDYYNTHHIFLTSDAVYLLVFDLSACLNSDKWIEQVIFWLQSIATLSYGNASDTESGSPPIIIVGTHLDKLQEMFKEEEEEVNKEIERIRHCLLDSAVARMIIGRHGIGMYSVSNLRPEDVVFTQIWDGILSSADKQSQWEKTLPGWWLERERVIMKKKSEGVKVQTFKEIQDIDQALPSSINNIKDVKMFLRHMHLTGNIIVSNNENLENAYIIIDPQWLVHAFSRLISPPKIQDPLSRGRDGLLWDIYEKTAELKLELVNLAWGKDKGKSESHEDSEKFLEYKDILLKIMEIFSLIAPLKNENVEGFEEETQQENTKFIVPCKLPEATPDLLKPVLEQANVVKTPSLCFAFKHNFIPFSIYDKIIASCIQRFEPFVYVSSGEEKIVQRGFVCVRLTHVWNMIICCKNAVMKVTLFRYSPHEKVKPEAGVGHPIRQILEDLLQRVWSITHEDKLQYTIEFHNDYRVQEREIRIPAADLRDGNGQRCAGAQSAEEYLKKEHYDIWFSTSVEGMQDEEFVDLGISKDILDKVVTEAAISDLSRCIGNTFYLLFTELGLSMPEIDQVLLDRKFPNFRTIVLKLLHMWYCGKAEEATYRILYQAMLKHGIKAEHMLSDVSGSEELLCDLAMAQSQPTQKQMALIAKYINSNFYMLFIDLGLQFDTIEKIQIDYSHSNSEGMYLKMLEKWLHIRVNEATIGVVLRAMKKHFMKYNDLLSEFRRTSCLH